jgi:hypothetical protein
MRHYEIAREASPNTWEGSFTPDLVTSKTWLVKHLKRELDGRSAGDIYVLGSWWGNLGVFIQQSAIEFDNLIMVERHKYLLDSTRSLLDNLWDQGRLKLVHSRAELVKYPNQPVTVINTSCNDMTDAWLEPVPDGSLVVMQGRNNIPAPKITTKYADEFYMRFDLKDTVYQGQRMLKDPETSYSRYMKIGYK